MSFHFNKTCNLVKPKTYFNTVEINYTSEVQFLGINISNNPKWNTHIQCFMLRLKQGVLYDHITMRWWNMYFAKFQCLIRYSIISWGGEIESLNILFFFKKKGSFIQLNGLNENGSCRQIFKKFKILTVTTFYIFEVLSYIKNKTKCI